MPLPIHTWLRGDSGLYQDAGKTVVAAANGDRVGCWADRSGNGHDCIQPTAGKRGTLVASSINGKPAVTFVHPNNQVLRSSVFEGLGAHSVFIVLDLQSGFLANIIPYCGADASGRTGVVWTDGSGGDLLHMQRSIAIASSAGIHHEYAILRADFADPGNARCFVDDPNDDMGTGSPFIGPGDAGIATVDRFSIGGPYVGDGEGYGADIAEVIIGSRLFTDAEWAELLAYGNERYFGAGAELVFTPAISGRLQFGAYEFPLGWKVTEDPNTRVVPFSKSPRTDGARSQLGYLDRKRVTAEGGFYKGPLDQSDIRPKIDALRSALSKGPQNLYLYADRYYRAMQATQYPDRYIPTGFNRMADSSVTFEGPDPFQYGVPEISDTWTAPADSDTRTLIVGGGAYTLPKIRFTVGGAGAATLDWRLENQTTREIMTLKCSDGSVSGGDVIVVDCLLQTVALEGSPDGVLRMDLFAGQFMRFIDGSNLLSVGVGAGSNAIAEINPLWHERWW